MIAQEGKRKVTILEMLPNIANGLESTHLGDLMVEFAELGVEAITNARGRSWTRSGRATSQHISCNCCAL